MKIKKIHEDKRGKIILIKGILEGEKEFTFMEIKKGFARGGCYHLNKEYFVVIKGKVKYIYGDIGGYYIERVLESGQSGIINPKVAHAFIALEDSIVSEWGITTSEKEDNLKDLKLRKIVDSSNPNEKKKEIKVKQELSDSDINKIKDIIEHG